MKYFKKLVGENIYLSPRNTEDVELFTMWLNDFNTSDYIGRSAAIATIENETEWLNKHTNDEASFVIVRLEDDKMIGTVCIENISHTDRIGTLGIFIGDMESRDKGYGTESIRLILDYAFNYLNLNNIKLDVKAFNERAIACYKKCGFKEIGRRRKSTFVDGKYYDTVIMDVLAEEFKESYIKNKNI
jgi:RimJ/RimL family protein N-acetyltransferase